MAGVMSMTVKKHEETGHFSFYHVPWEPTTFIFTGYEPYVEGLKPYVFMVLGSKGSQFPLFRMTTWMSSPYLLANIDYSVAHFERRRSPN